MTFWMKYSDSFVHGQKVRKSDRNGTASIQWKTISQTDLE